MWRDLVTLVELGIVERQKGDKPWAECLMRIREGAQTDADVEMLESRVVANLGLAPDDPSIHSLPHCFHTNKEASFTLPRHVALSCLLTAPSLSRWTR